MVNEDFWWSIKCHNNEQFGNCSDGKTKWNNLHSQFSTIASDQDTIHIQRENVKYLVLCKGARDPSGCNYSTQTKASPHSPLLLWPFRLDGPPPRRHKPSSVLGAPEGQPVGEDRSPAQKARLETRRHTSACPLCAPRFRTESHLEDIACPFHRVKPHSASHYPRSNVLNIEHLISTHSTMQHRDVKDYSV